jgi:hypothetical protein
LVVRIERVDPRLDQIGGLREYESRAAGLVIGKRALDVVEKHRARRRRPSLDGDADEGQRCCVENDSLMMLRDVLACGAVTAGSRAAEDEDVHEVGRVGGAW